MNNFKLRNKKNCSFNHQSKYLIMYNVYLLVMFTNKIGNRSTYIVLSIKINNVIYFAIKMLWTYLNNM